MVIFRNPLLISDQQDRFAAPSRLGTGTLCPPLREPLHRWQVDFELGTHPGTALHLDVTPTLSDDAEHHRAAQPSAVASPGTMLEPQHSGG